MSTIRYTIKPGSGPNLDRLADSWRYCNDPTAEVPVTFTVTRRHGQVGVEPYEVTIEVMGNVRALLHLTDRVVEVKLDVVQDGRPLQSVEVTAQYDHKTRSGNLDWVIAH